MKVYLYLVPDVKYCKPKLLHYPQSSGPRIKSISKGLRAIYIFFFKPQINIEFTFIFVKNATHFLKPGRIIIYSSYRFHEAIQRFGQIHTQMKYRYLPMSETFIQR